MTSKNHTKTSYTTPLDLTVFNHLRSAIETGHLEVGVRLPSENALAKQYGVSRTVIREVLR
ncbi:winged helix-turn-helix domain-containing protein, partial [Mycolicibacterium goodii]|nr:winged helix-turn-helix domain-containing protein [Mycolicibacterium goodii]